MSEVKAYPLATPPDPRTVFKSMPDSPGMAGQQVIPRVRDILSAVISYYRVSLSWRALLATSVVMCYVGGAAMFWYHAVYLGEGGPAIAWPYHWLLDSTFGFVALTPALAVLMPLATWVAGQTIGRLSPAAVPLGFAVLVGAGFAVITTPGPIAHDLLVGRGTWLANRVTAWIGDPSAPAVPHHHENGLLAELTQQFGFGLPLYVVLACVAVLAIRMTTARWRAPEGL